MRDDFSSFEEARWSKGDHRLGRSHLDPANVDTANGMLRLKLPAHTTDGAEIQSVDFYGYGSYEARIKVPGAPSSLTGFFLYQPPDEANEVDIEIFNGGSRQIMFTYFSSGRQVSETRSLPFDPASGFHDYRFDYRPDALQFFVDGEFIEALPGGLPVPPLRLYANAWYPNWLAGESGEVDRYVSVDHILYKPHSVS